MSYCGSAAERQVAVESRHSSGVRPEAKRRTPSAGKLRGATKPNKRPRTSKSKPISRGLSEKRSFKVWSCKPPATPPPPLLLLLSLLLLLLIGHLSTCGQALWLWDGQAKAASKREGEQERELAKVDEHYQQLQAASRMSCFAGSTMDYANPSDNICRELRKRDELSGGQLMGLAARHWNTKQPVLLQQQQARSAGGGGGSLAPGDGHQMRFVSSILEPESERALDEGDLGEEEQEERDARGSNSSTKRAQLVSRAASGGQLLQTISINSKNTSLQTQTSGPRLQPSLAAGRQADRASPHNFHSDMPTNSIKLRPCSESENFCSIISVVRLEFVQEHYYSKFWALDRNCSRSCNTGCMLIGERVRLRVCSQCCRTPNCNVAGGAAASSWRLKPDLIGARWHLMLTLFALCSSLMGGQQVGVIT